VIHQFTIISTYITGNEFRYQGAFFLSLLDLRGRSVVYSLGILERREEGRGTDGEGVEYAYLNLNGGRHIEQGQLFKQIGHLHSVISWAGGKSRDERHPTQK
jgi:hypothetical protein